MRRDGRCDTSPAERRTSRPGRRRRRRIAAAITLTRDNCGLPSPLPNGALRGDLAREKDRALGERDAAISGRPRPAPMRLASRRGPSFSGPGGKRTSRNKRAFRRRRRRMIITVSPDAEKVEGNHPPKLYIIYIRGEASRREQSIGAMMTSTKEHKRKLESDQCMHLPPSPPDLAPEAPWTRNTFATLAGLRSVFVFRTISVRLRRNRTFHAGCVQRIDFSPAAPGALRTYYADRAVPERALHAPSTASPFRARTSPASRRDRDEVGGFRPALGRGGSPLSAAFSVPESRDSRKGRDRPAPHRPLSLPRRCPRPFPTGGPSDPRPERPKSTKTLHGRHASAKEINRASDIVKTDV